ncbi:hypothetical protein RUM43_009238 [Polyplax serrata]|uniref:Uncharacterized protein n=1 Tax=Polyplax serrata TaxID=468196 RepID=A0AAN8S113_POLSC
MSVILAIPPGVGRGMRRSRRGERERERERWRLLEIATLMLTSQQQLDFPEFSMPLGLGPCHPPPLGSSQVALRRQKEPGPGD